MVETDLRTRPQIRCGSVGTIRSATLIGFREAATSVGLDPAELLEAVGLDPTCEQDCDDRIALDAFLALLAMSAEQARCGDFGARAARAAGLPDYGPLSLALREAETVQDAIRCYSKHLWLHCDDAAVELDKQADSPFIKLDMPECSLEEIAQLTQFVIVGMKIQLSWLTGGCFRPKLICFAFPRLSGASTLSPILECEVAYNQAFSGIVFDADFLRKTVVTSEPSMRRIALRQLARVLVDPQSQFVANVFKAVRHLLPIGECSSEKIAARFRMDLRTFNRRLSREGLTFMSIVQQTRVQLTINALGRDRFTITEIADFVGFNSVSSFSRWFRATFGCSARDWRQGIRPQR